MNQILYNCNKNSKVLKINDKEIVSYNNTSNPFLSYVDLQSDYFSCHIKKIKWYKVIFFTALFLLIFFIILFLIRLYEEISKKLTSSYSVSTMFSNSLTSSYSTDMVDNTPFVIRNN